jgi:hypothetical protein
VREGRDIKPTVRNVASTPGLGYGWLRNVFLAHRCTGLSPVAARSEPGFFKAKTLLWEEEFLDLGDGLHHPRVRVEVEETFWAHYDEGRLGVGGPCGCGSRPSNGLPMAAGPIHRTTRCRHVSCSSKEGVRPDESLWAAEAVAADAVPAPNRMTSAARDEAARRNPAVACLRHGRIWSRGESASVGRPGRTGVPHSTDPRYARKFWTFT